MNTEYTHKYQLRDLQRKVYQHLQSQMLAPAGLSISVGRVTLQTQPIDLSMLWAEPFQGGATLSRLFRPHTST